MNAKSLDERGERRTGPGVPRCGKLLTDGGIDGATASNLQPNVDFWQLADIPAGTLKKDKTYILAVTGCTANAEGAPPATAERNDDGTPGSRPRGTPGPATSEIPRRRARHVTGVAATRIGAAALNLSPQHEAVTKRGPAVGPFKPTLANADVPRRWRRRGRRGGKFPVTADFDELALQPQRDDPSPIAKIKGLVTSTGYFALAPKTATTESLNGPVKLNNVERHAASDRPGDDERRRDPNATGAVRQRPVVHVRPRRRTGPHGGPGHARDALPRRSRTSSSTWRALLAASRTASRESATPFAF